MSIKKIQDLKLFIQKKFDVNFNTYHLDINKHLPVALQEIYLMDHFFAKHNCVYETIRFFRNMDRLTLYSNLKLEDEQFVFATENQGNWYAKTSLHSEKVFIYNHEEIKDGTALLENIEEFLISFALLELSNNFKHFCGLYENNEAEIKKEFKKIEDLWVDKKYLLRPVSFYLIDDEILYDEANCTLASNNEEKLKYWKSAFKTFNYH